MPEDINKAESYDLLRPLFEKVIGESEWATLNSQEQERVLTEAMWVELGKPDTTNGLKSVIQNVLSLDESVMSSHIKTVLAEIGRERT